MADFRCAGAGAWGGTAATPAGGRGAGGFPREPAGGAGPLRWPRPGPPWSTLDGAGAALPAGRGGGPVSHRRAGLARRTISTLPRAAWRLVRRLAVAVLILATALAGVALAGHAAAAATGPALAGAGAETGTITLAGGRTYLLHAAAQLAPAARPLVIALHGANHTAATMQRMSGLDVYADLHRLIVAYGAGVGGRWNAGSCCTSAPQDDIGYLRALVADVARRTPIDRSRVYVVGFSNGGMMAWRAACEAPDLIAAAGVVAGALLVPCGQTRVRLYHVHGRGDGTVPLAGGVGFEGHTFPDSRRESTRVAAGSVVTTEWWSGGHGWPGFATAAMVSTLTTVRLGQQAGAGRAPLGAVRV